ncbi:hypothetical protein C7N43_05495 [Sphingobacteriales bacterium UPWRP_1]|nr:hypothetical protein BVG80_06370 [Sphingobacteriales bacterium TSM_CSM]PSJ78033.1 hypothetical protein C7N43_05495 [Sphingobacteriales bacterium UPWRP_1]
MSETNHQYSLPEAHRYFAGECLETAAGLLRQPSRTAEQNQLLETVAQTGYYHNLHSNDKTAYVRCLWLLTKVYAALCNSAKSLYFAHKCRAESGEYDTNNALAYAYACEAMGRAFNAGQQPEQAHGYLQLALDVADTIANVQDNRQFLEDFSLPCEQSGNEDAI